MSDDDAPLRLRADAPEFLLGFEGAEVDLTPVKFQAHEAMSRPYELRIEAVAPRASARAPAPHELLGLSATFSLLHDTGTRRFQGVVAGAAVLGERRGYRIYELHLVSDTWLLGQRRRTRVWQAMTTDEIFVHLLKDAGFADERLHVSLEKTRTPRDQCIQYRETDLDFLTRLLAEDGMYWFHAWLDGSSAVADEDGKSKIGVVLTDQMMTHEPLIEAEEVQFRTSAFAGGAGTYVHAVQWHRVARPTAVELQAYDFRRAAEFGELSFAGDPGHARLDSVAFENELHHELPGAGWALRQVSGGADDKPEDRAPLGSDASKPKDERPDTVASEAASHRAAALRADAALLRGKSDVRQVRVGFLLKLVDHPDDDMNDAYLLTEVTHRGRQAPPDEPEWVGGDGDETYANEFVGSPSDVLYRPPPPRHRPRIDGIQLGVVTGPAGEEIHVDPLLRIKVRFFWDPHPSADDASSAWVRVLQPWAGNGWGHVTIPRVGQEVVVQFVDGDPDQPIVLGTLYNGTNKPPYDLPEHKTRFGFKSRSTPNDSDSNELRFEDKKGEEELYLHASNAMNVSVDGDASRTVGNNDTLDVTELRKVSSKNTEVVVEEDHKTHVGRSTTWESDQDMKVVTPVFKLESKTGEGSITLESSQKIELKCGGSTITIDPSSITITTTTLTMNSTDFLSDASSSAKVKSPDVHAGDGTKGFNAKSGAVELKGSTIDAEADTTAKLKGNASVEVTGTQATVNGSATTEIKGGMVKLN